MDQTKSLCNWKDIDLHVQSAVCAFWLELVSGNLHWEDNMFLLNPYS